MPPRSDLEADLICIRHMLDSAKEALSFVKGKKRQDLDRERQLALALTKELEILGEAASRVSETFKAAHPEIPWAAIIATRNRLIHGYFDVDLEIVWTTITKHLPGIVSALARIQRG